MFGFQLSVMRYNALSRLFPENSATVRKSAPPYCEKFACEGHNKLEHLQHF